MLSVPNAILIHLVKHEMNKFKQTLSLLHIYQSLFEHIKNNITKYIWIEKINIRKRDSPKG